MLSSSQSRVNGRLGFSTNKRSRSNSLAVRVELGAVGQDQHVPLKIQHRVADTRLGHPGPGRRRIAAPAQHCFHARGQLARLNGLAI